MAAPKSSPNRPDTDRFRKYPPRPPASPPEVVDPIWLLKAFAIVVVAALVCGYGSLCLLLYQGQWQLILHPARSTAPPPPPGELIRFGTDESGTPQLTGWLFPAADASPYPGFTALVLPAGDGSLADAVPTLTALRDAGLAVFAIDYRGYGQSALGHPTQARMTEDTASALRYLTATRGLPEDHILPVGLGVGASLATHLAAAHPALPALILANPGPDPLATILKDPRTRFLPVRALVHERFPLAEPLASLKTPKLLIAPEGQAPAFTSAAPPRLTVWMPTGAPPAPRAEVLRRFLDQYLAHGPQPLTPHPLPQGTIE